MLIVVDTNVLVSGLLGSPSCRRILSLLNRDVLSLALSPILLEEFCFVINRPKFRNLIANEEKMAIIKFLRAKALFVDPSISLNICRDRKDNKVLECAVEAKAGHIITGDKDLLTLSPFKGIKIFPPSQFLKLARTL